MTGGSERPPDWVKTHSRARILSDLPSAQLHVPFRRQSRFRAYRALLRLEVVVVSNQQH